MATLQVKGMNDRLYESLKARAEADRRSVSQEVVYVPGLVVENWAK